MSGSCSRCGDELSEYSSCSCAFAPHYPRAASSSATAPPQSMRAMLARAGHVGRNLPELTCTQRGALARLARGGASHVHGSTAARLLLFNFIEQRSTPTSSGHRATYQITPQGLEAHRALARAYEDRSQP